MKIIAEYVYSIDEELESAKAYAEKHLYAKSMDKYPDTDYYLTMAKHELQHVDFLHEMAVAEVKRLSEVYKPTSEMQKVWDESHAHYVEQSAWIKQMLAM